MGGLSLNKLTLRDSPHIQDNIVLVHDFEFPNKNDLSYTNHIIGFVARKSAQCGVNVIMSNNQRSALPQDHLYQEVKINPADAVVKRVVMWGDSDSEFRGV
jgi:hypothetical protein